MMTRAAPVYGCPVHDRLLEEGIDPSIGTGSPHDNSLAESVNGLYKTELIKPRRPWRNAAHVEAGPRRMSTGSTTGVYTSTAGICRRSNWKGYSMEIWRLMV